jgi:hypothetical protein
MTETSISTAAPVSAPASAAAGGPASAAAPTTGDGFTALLLAALSGTAPTVDADGMPVTLAASADPDAVDVPGTTEQVEGEVPSAGQGLTDAVLALIANGLPTLVTPQRQQGASADGAAADGAVAAAIDAAVATADDATAVATAATSAGEVPTPAGGTPPVTVDVDALLEATMARAGAATGEAPANGASGTPAAGTTKAATVDGETVQPAPSPPTGGSAVPTIDPAASAPDGDRPVPPPASVTPPTGATTAAPASAGVDTGATHARMVARVMDALDVLQNAPPPRRMTIELPDADGLRLQVALRGSEVHVSVQGGGSTADVSAWSRELTAGLSARGFNFGGFGAGTGQHDRERAQDQLPDQPSTPTSARRRPRPAPADHGLRL